MVTVKGFTYTAPTQITDDLMREFGRVDAYIVDVMHQIREEGTQLHLLQDYAERLAQVRCAQESFLNHKKWQRWVKDHGK